VATQVDFIKKGEHIMTEEEITLEIPVWVYPLMVLALLITLSTAGYIYLGFLVTAPVMLAGFLALVAWYGTTYRQPRKRRILPLYIALIIVLLLQGLEQWYFGYPEVIKTLFPASFAPPVVFTETIFLSIFVFGATTLFLFAAVGIFFHHHLGNYVGWFMMVYAVIGGLLLLGWPLLAGQLDYLPGMVMAPLGILMGLMGISRLSKKTDIGGVLS
jgi:membrane-associated HD superfamily phosphohydrolase